MEGKSTFLKAVGMNAVLAYAGAPVSAARARLSSFTLCASNSISDSLLDGKSKFLAEAERLCAILRQTRTGKPVLFLVDEILSGTNSQDRRIACESIVRALIAVGAVGILSTHDLALTEIAGIYGLQGLNCCMESDNPRDPPRLRLPSQTRSLAAHERSGHPRDDRH
jgi:DNA mismatch repair ATPase MutS